MYQYKNLDGVALGQIAECLNLAFSDYPIPIHLNEEELGHFLAADGVDLTRSYGAFCGEEMVGFLLHSFHDYRGCRAVFDAGTGVVPAHRGKKVMTQLFAYAKQQLAQNAVERYYLEVLQQNDKAIALYEKQGFSVVREFSVLRACGLPEDAKAEAVSFMPASAFESSQAAECHRPEPSFEHADPVWQQNPDAYQVASLGEAELTAYCLFAKESGQILQLGWRNMRDLAQVLQGLLARYPQVTAKNIDRSEGQLLELLSELGFQEVARQFEMEKSLCGE